MLSQSALHVIDLHVHVVCHGPSSLKLQQAECSAPIINSVSVVSCNVMCMLQTNVLIDSGGSTVLADFGLTQDADHFQDMYT